LIPLIAPDNRGHASLADACVSNYDDPTSLFARAEYRAIFHCLGEPNV